MKQASLIGREDEQELLRTLSNQTEPAIAIVYGRRRVGKTFLIENTFPAKSVLSQESRSRRSQRIWKFEGLEDRPQKEQIKHTLVQLSQYLADPFIAHLQLDEWRQVFGLIAGKLPKGNFVLYFEEVQWLANYENEFASDLKFVWDNQLKQKSGLLVILCGSSPSFMLSKIVLSKALYNRSQHEIPLQQFSLAETKLFLSPGRSKHEVLDGYLSVGGIPEYLKYIDRESSVFLGLCKNSFAPGAFFLREHEKVLVSSLAQSTHYSAIIAYLAKTRFATRAQISEHLKIEAGGSLTKILLDLERCGFIASYAPYNLLENSNLKRYAIGDNYLQFYFKFIHPLKKDIEAGRYKKNPVSALNNDTYRKWLGYAFERYLRLNSHIVASRLGFSAVQYKSGAYFDRKSAEGFQLDLVFAREDKVFTACEVKYTDRAVSLSQAKEFNLKLEAIRPSIKSRTIEKVLISVNGCDSGARSYFDRVLTLDDFI